MKKRTINLISYKSLWLFITMLPLIIFIVMCINANQPIDLFSFLKDSFGMSTTSFSYEVLTSFFGVDSQYLPMFPNNSATLLYLSYVVNIAFCRLIVDMLLFIPRMCTKIFNVGGNDYD